nr:hypothetical protein BaRGS_012372 [Batillaria attramentaria]
MLLILGLNLPVGYVFWSTDQLRNPKNMYIASMLITDILLAAMIPVRIYYMHFLVKSDVSCRVVRYFTMLMVNVNVYSVLALALARHKQITRARRLGPLTKRQALRIIAYAWCITVIASSRVTYLSAPQHVVLNQTTVTFCSNPVIPTLDDNDGDDDNDDGDNDDDIDDTDNGGDNVGHGDDEDDDNVVDTNDDDDADDDVDTHHDDDDDVDSNDDDDDDTDDDADEDDVDSNDSDDDDDDTDADDDDVDSNDNDDDDDDTDDDDADDDDVDSNDNDDDDDDTDDDDDNDNDDDDFFQRVGFIVFELCQISMFSSGLTNVLVYIIFNRRAASAMLQFLYMLVLDMQNCIETVVAWMTNNKLKMNVYTE